MAEIPGIVWCIVGIFISIFSFFVNTKAANPFFIIMIFVGICMFIYGFIKIKSRQKSPQQEMEERRMQTYQRGEREVDIDIDDYRRNPQLRQHALPGASQYVKSTQATHYGTPRTFPQQTNAYSHQPTHQTSHRHSTHTPHSNHVTHSSQNIYNHSSQPGQRICPNCRTPLLKHHKICPICNVRV